MAGGTSATVVAADRVGELRPVFLVMRSSIGASVSIWSARTVGFVSVMKGAG